MDDENGDRVVGDEGAEMRNNENTRNMEANMLIGDMAEEENQKKRSRIRRKKIYETIRNRMEFYFSDANLSKDRFLSKLIENNPEVDLAVFLRFNKIRDLTDNIKDIKSSLKHSELLAVSEDGTRVFRTKPIELKDNEDECTIYVEKLPLEANHEWLQQVFSQYGTVDYISIPKYKTTGKIKGFAFVEFHTPEEAKKTLEVFGAVGCCLSSNIEPDKLHSIRTFEIEERGYGSQLQQPSEEIDSLAAGHGKRKRSGEDGGQERLMEEDGAELVTVTLQEHTGDSDMSKKAKATGKHEHKIFEKECSMKDEKKGKRKRKHVDNTCEEEGESSDKGKKKQKDTEDGADVVERQDPTVTAEKKKRQKHPEVPSKSDEETEEDPSCKDEKKGKRKRKHREVSVHNEEEERGVSSKDMGKQQEVEVVHAEKSSPGAEKLGKRKRQVEVAAEEEGEDVPEKKAKTDSDVEKEHGDTETENSAVEDEVHKKKKSRHRKKKKRKQIAQEVSSLGLQVLSKTEWKRLRNKYLNLQRLTMKNLKQQLSRTRKWDARGIHTNGHSQHSEHADERSVEEVSGTAPSAPRFSYTPGVIVHVMLDAPVIDIKKFKAEAKSHGNVEYVAVQEGATEAFIRCSTAEAAKALVSSQVWQEATVLEGEEDKQYWERIKQERQHMTCRQKKKKRGRDKLLARAEKALSKHIKFDETV